MSDLEQDLSSEQKKRQRRKQRPRKKKPASSEVASAPAASSAPASAVAVSATAASSSATTPTQERKAGKKQTGTDAKKNRAVADLTKAQLLAKRDGLREGLRLTENPVYNKFSGTVSVASYPLPVLFPRVDAETKGRASSMVRAYVNAVVAHSARQKNKESAGEVKKAKEELEAYQKTLSYRVRTITFKQAGRATEVAYALLRVSRELTAKTVAEVVKNDRKLDYGDVIVRSAHVHDEPGPPPIVGVHEDRYGVLSVAAMVAGFNIFAPIRAEHHADALSNMRAVMRGMRLISRMGAGREVLAVVNRASSTQKQPAIGGISVKQTGVVPPEDARPTPVSFAVADMDDVSAQRAGVHAWVINSVVYDNEEGVAEAMLSRLTRSMPDPESKHTDVCVAVTRVVTKNAEGVARFLVAKFQAAADSTGVRGRSLNVYCTSYVEEDATGMILCAELTPTRETGLSFLAALSDVEMTRAIRIKYDQLRLRYELESDDSVYDLILEDVRTKAKLVFPRSYMWDTKQSKFTKVGVRALKPLVAAKQTGKAVEAVTQKDVAKAEPAAKAIAAQASLGAAPKTDGSSSGESKDMKKQAKKRERKRSTKEKKAAAKEPTDVPSEAAAAVAAASGAAPMNGTGGDSGDDDDGDDDTEQERGTRGADDSSLTGDDLRLAPDDDYDADL